MAAKITRLTQNSDTTASSGKGRTICSSRSRRPVRKLLDTSSYTGKELQYRAGLCYQPHSRLMEACIPLITQVITTNAQEGISNLP